MLPQSNAPIITAADLYHYLDDLFEQDVDGDTLFASSYLRGFISLAATDFGDEQQTLCAALLTAISEQLSQAKTELSPQDNVIVQNFWLALQKLLVIE
ncbi:MAG: YfcL family protein [Colwellia sp.]|nr:YfcL family protein [Colwellia sp.]MCW8863765.1 YfcL family protein [Colwellia sp.]MCW9081946.1 YfcL family protein [Colwellia sp.]